MLLSLGYWQDFSKQSENFVRMTGKENEHNPDLWKLNPRWLVLFTVLTIVLLMTGCTENSTPAGIEEIPIPNELTIYEGTMEPTLDMAAVALQQAYGSDTADVEIRYYWAPQSMNWEQVRKFYQDEFAGSDSGWVMDEEAALHNLDVWTRDTTAGKQTLVLSMVPVPDGEGYIMMMVLASPK